MKKLILAIETSADDTSIALVKGNDILAMKTHSQIEEHAKFGGIIPEMASRYHSKNIFDQIKLVMKDTEHSLENIDAIAVTIGPGMVNTLQVGMTIAKTLSYKLMVPLYGINHIEAHAFSPFIGGDIIVDKSLIIIASGGHTNIIAMKKLFEYEMLGQTKDDAIGEAYDKVAKIIGLNYPGGPLIDKISAENNNISKIKFPKPKVIGYDFSYSGLKSKALQLKEKKEFTNEEIATGFQVAAVKQLIDKIKLAIKEFNFKNIILGGGVTANSYLRSEINKIKDVNVFFPKLMYTGDNAAMIGYLASKKISKKKIKKSSLDIDAEPRMRMS